MAPECYESWLWRFLGIFIYFEPAHDKTYNKTYANSEDSDQPAHPRSQISVFADRVCLLQPQIYPKRLKKNSYHTGWM